MASPCAADEHLGRLCVDAPDGAEVVVDGRSVAVTPLDEPLLLTPGKHEVVIAKTGHHAHRQAVTLAAGKASRLTADLSATDQRVGAWILLSSGWASVSAAVVLGVLSVVEHRKSRDIARGDEDLSEEQERAMDEAIAARDDFRIASGVTAATGIVGVVVGAALFVLDDPLPDDVSVAATPSGAALTLRF
jgi:hypothetical protein